MDMQLTILDILTNTRFLLQVDENITLQELKSRIYENGNSSCEKAALKRFATVGIPGGFQKLLFCGSPLQPGSLRDQGVENRSILFLLSVRNPPFGNFILTVGVI